MPPKNPTQALPAEATHIRAAAELEQISGADGLKAISGVAYSGGPIIQPWSRAPIYIDLAGLSIRAQVPLIYNHYNSPLSRLGVVQPSISDGQLRISGGIDPEADSARQIISMGQRIPWQLSIGALPENIEEVFPDSSAQVNGREVQGPALIARQASLYEISLVAIGADAKTHLKISAALNIPSPSPTPQPKEPTMPPKPATTPDPQASLPVDPAPNVAATATPPVPPAPAPVDNSAIQAALAAERQRVSDIEGICARHPEIGTQARQEGWSADQTRKAVLDAINASYSPSAPNIQSRDSSVTMPILAAAAWHAAGFSEQSIEAAHGREALDSASRRWRSGIGLQELIIEAAAANGGVNLPRRLTSSNWHGVCYQAVQASVSGVSQVNLDGLLGGVISRALLQGFGEVDSSWRQIAGKRNVKDFREIVSYRLAADGGFEQVGPTGELKHGELSETEYRNKAETFGQLLSVTRQDIINDDLGALTAIPTELGLVAAMKFNQVFWTEFMDNSDFFTLAAGNLLANDPLSIEGLTAARKAFMALRDQSGRMLGLTPSILLTPPSLTTLASQLFKNDQIIAIGMGNSAKVVPSGNPHTGKYTPVESPYLEDETIPGYSSTAYYLLAKPTFRASIQAVFLDGVESPTIESSALVFDQLGLSWRAYFDFGVRKMDPVAGIKVAGSPA